MTTRTPTQCVACAHFTGPNGAGNPACRAYPGGIPNRIVYFGADHRQPSKGDGGVRFAQKEGEQAAADFALWQYVFAPEEAEMKGGGSGGN